MPTRRAPRRRTTESALETPSLARAMRVLWRVVRLRCPHCGRGTVLGRLGRVRQRCVYCGLRYERSDDNYFQGAMFFQLLLCGGVFIVSLFVIVMASLPHVPWDALTYGAPLGILVAFVLLRPASMVFWLGFDILLRPVTGDELQP